ncbi:hypothetical protein V1524DRAFT_412199 [Lipomyces starkeyi]
MNAKAWSVEGQFGKRVRRIEYDDSEGNEAVDNNQRQGFDLGGDEDGQQEHELNCESAAYGPLQEQTTEASGRKGNFILSLLSPSMTLPNKKSIVCWTVASAAATLSTLLTGL